MSKDSATFNMIKIQAEESILSNHCKKILNNVIFQLVNVESLYLNHKKACFSLSKILVSYIDSLE